MGGDKALVSGCAAPCSASAASSGPASAPHAVCLASSGPSSAPSCPAAAAAAAAGGGAPTAIGSVQFQRLPHRRSASTAVVAPPPSGPAGDPCDAAPATAVAAPPRSGPAGDRMDHTRRKQ
ncbi:hypothetical protein C4D60_Mb03t11550 [Musa balbisiana]|uniref:Uncharacterized protein n=1 Tax=Musa balbisiana TaxID=52838 RepID=A0A4S8J9A6_MUSBA|nr:hypothetical protein C4D60_Mb03t11550 [Musa balbisiana]